MIRRRTAHLTIAAGLAAAALSAAAVLPAHAATGTGWRIVSTRHFGAAGGYNFLSVVATTSSGDAWAFGGSDGATMTGTPIAEHWNGSTWVAATLPNGLTDGIAAASEPSADDIWTVGDFSGTVLYYNGTTWSVAKQFPESVNLPLEGTGVIAFSPTNVWVFGGPGEDPGLGTWHLQGTTWTQVTGIGASITAASALSPKDIWAYGGDAQGSADIIVHYNGTAWQQVTSSALDNIEFSDILATSATSVWATGANLSGTTPVPYLFHMNGTTWTRIKIPWAVDPRVSASDGNGGLWITADEIASPGSEYVLHRTKAGVWSRSKLAASDGLNNITSIPGTTSLWGAGSKLATSGSNAAIWAYGTLP